ncbi:MAG: hypothetical protein UX81_C0013G0004 [Parcubacteria group bacterium GW2011_GWA2_47_12]|nr:MAG: hypothetical protein UX81_C0013G0004 [Parcubacteria group bacterium GW2011_GWA2_47_12]
MTTKEAQQLVQKTFQNPFDKGQFVYFIKNLVNEVDESKAFHARGYVHEKYRDKVKTYERVGTYTDPEENKIDILIVYLQKESSIDRARTTLRNFVGDYLKERGEKEAGLVAFVSPNQKDWRFSLVKMEYKIIETPSGRVKAKEEFTPAKRYSFLVGVEETSHTAQSRLVPILEDDASNPTLKQIEEAFNIEKVTKEFFEKYRDLYLRVKDTLDEVLKNDKEIKADFAGKNIDTVDFGKKLLGQIVFLYFLQKKGWFGVKRGEEWGSGSKNFLRELFDKKHGDYKNFFNDTLEPLFYEALRNDRSHDDHYFSMFKCKIPFLNGGLFDPINNYDWKETDIILPNELFSNSYKTKEGDIGTGVLDIFDRYNFTVKEDEPLEKEVAVDPEMLGKVFENLLEVKDRKSKGTYYTPREIVHYMCQESLVNYLATGLDKKVSKKDIETLIKYGEVAVEHDATSVKKKTKDPKYKSSYYKARLPKSIEKHAKLIDEKLETIRICDPAVGSGAFPVGMMNEIIRTRNALTSYLKTKKGRTIYDFKRHAIQNSLYGVDIDLGAVEIAKLRLWLSLIVDEEDIKQIKPLPNLDYKIIQGNSLLGIQKEKGGMKDMFYDHSMSELEKIIRLHLNEANANKKREYKEKIDELIDKITHGHKEFDFEVYFSEVFREKSGFDVVIANPPYIRIHKQEQGKGIKERIKQMYVSAYKDFDYYVLFIEKGLNILKKDGVLTYITPDKYLVREYGSKIRGLILQYSIVELFDLSRATDIFEAATYPLISIIQKNNKLDKVTIKIARTIRNLTEQYKEIVIPKQRCIDNDRIEIIDPEFDKLITKIFSRSSKLSDILEPGQLFCGTPRAKDYHAWSKHITNNKKVGECLRVLVCSNIKPYVISHKKKVRTVGLSIFAPYFCNDKKAISETRWQDFVFTPKILIRGNDTRITAVLDEEGSVFIGIYGIKVCAKIANNYKYLLALLNSKLYQWIFSVQNPSIKIGGEFFSINAPHILRLPFRQVLDGEQNDFNKIVDKILAITKDDDYLENPARQAKVRDYEKQIDQLVYKLYGLTPEEIKIVESTK